MITVLLSEETIQRSKRRSRATSGPGPSFADLVNTGHVLVRSSDGATLTLYVDGQPVTTFDMADQHVDLINIR